MADSLLAPVPPNMEPKQPLFPQLYIENERALNGRLAIPRKFIQKLLKEAGREKATLHSFRHFFNNSLRNLGLSIEDRQVLLAHSSNAITKVYTHPNFSLAKKYVDQISYLS